jgi:hypothetical protein
MRYFVHSTLTQSRKYHQWSRPADPHMSPEIIGTPVTIRGGANVATFPDSRYGRHTPSGIATEVSEEQMDYLNGCPMFKKHMDKGFITVTTSKESPEKVARDLEKRDGSAPLTPDSPAFNAPDPEEQGEEKFITTAVRVLKKAIG